MSIDTTLFLALNGSATSPHWLTALAVFSTRHLPELLAAGAAGVFLAGSRRVRMGVLQVLAAMAVAVLVSWSRVYLGLHFPSDIVAGALVGVASGWLACHLLRRSPIPSLTATRTAKELP